MATLANHITPKLIPTRRRWPLAHVLILLGLWLVIFVSALSTPPLLDDADATHAQAAQAMLSTGNWVTLHVDGIRYLEKPPLPYWIAALSLRLFAPRAPIKASHQLTNQIAANEPPPSAAFAIHLPLALTVLGLALLGYAWSRRAFPPPHFGTHAPLYTAIFTLTSAGVFLFTRIFIPDALLSLLLAFALYALLRSLDPAQASLDPAPASASLSNQTSAIPSEERSAQREAVILSERSESKDPETLHSATTSGTFLTKPPGAPFMRALAHKWVPQDSQTLWPYAMWLALALAVLTKGLVSLVFIFGTAVIFLYWTDQLRKWRRLRPFTGILLFLAVAAPWHILAGLRNTGGANGHGFFWFYFINEHVLRFLGRRIPRDYNKLPGYLYWSLHIVWLFPWSLFAPAASLYAWRNRKNILVRTPPNQSSVILSEGDRGSIASAAVEGPRQNQPSLNRSSISNRSAWGVPESSSFTRQTILILLLFSALVLVFFSISTNQEYYTFPVYLPLLMLLAAALSAIERNPTPISPISINPSPNNPGAPGASPLGTWVPTTPTLRRSLTFAYAAFTVIGLAIAAALAYGLWSARHLPFVPDIGELLAHRNVGDYTLSMSHFFDLTGHSFAALRLPATLALIAFLTGPPIAWLFHARRRSLPAILTVALTSTVFLVAAHIALVRFGPMLSSANVATTIETLEHNGSISPNSEVLIFGDQAFGSSIPFYLAQYSGQPNRRVLLVDGRTTSMLFGSTFPDAPPIFLNSTQLLAQWGTGPRKLLFVPLEQRDTVDRLLGTRQIILQQTSGKALITDRPLQPTTK